MASFISLLCNIGNFSGNFVFETDDAFMLPNGSCLLKFSSFDNCSKSFGFIVFIFGKN